MTYRSKIEQPGFKCSLPPIGGHSRISQLGAKVHLCRHCHAPEAVTSCQLPFLHIWQDTMGQLHNMVQSVLGPLALRQAMMALQLHGTLCTVLYVLSTSTYTLHIFKARIVYCRRQRARLHW